MHRVRDSLILASILLALGSCASSAKLTRVEPAIAVVQTSTNPFLMEQGGQLAVVYMMAIRNTTSEPITLTRLEMKTIGGGPYLLRGTPVTFHRSIAPGKTAKVRFSMWAWSPGGRTVAAEPVVLSGLVWFDSPSGSFSTRFLQRIRQPQSPGA